MMNRAHNKRPVPRGQSLLEYSTVLGIVVVILMAMQPLIKRSTQSMIKVVADQIGFQRNADQPFDYSSYLENAYMVTRSTLSEERREANTMANFYYQDRSLSRSTQYMNLGVSGQ